MRIVVSLLTLLLPGVALAGRNALYEKAIFSADSKTLNYRVLKPAKIEEGKKYPLVLFLHGAGERGTDNEKQLVHGSSLFTQSANRAKFPAYVVFPQCPENKMWVDVPWGDKKPHTMPKEPGEPLKLTKQMLDGFIKDNAVDPSRVYVMGLSMGGFGTWDFIARYPDFVAAAVPICGGADDSTASAIKHLPIWAFHGADDTVVHTVRSQSIAAALKKVDGKIRYTEYPKVGHNSWSPAFAESELLPWLFAQKRTEKP
jgi:predicted peptidase